MTTPEPENPPCLPEMIPVVSSNVAAIGWQPQEAGLGTLFIRFTAGGTYAYPDVPAAAHAALLAAQSKGKHFAAYIRRQYPHTKCQ